MAGCSARAKGPRAARAPADDASCGLLTHAVQPSSVPLLHRSRLLLQQEERAAQGSESPRRKTGKVPSSLPAAHRDSGPVTAAPPRAPTPKWVPAARLPAPWCSPARSRPEARHAAARGAPGRQHLAAKWKICLRLFLHVRQEGRQPLGRWPCAAEDGRASQAAAGSPTSTQRRMLPVRSCSHSAGSSSLLMPRHQQR